MSETEAPQAPEAETKADEHAEAETMHVQLPGEPEGDWRARMFRVLTEIATKSKARRYDPVRVQAATRALEHLDRMRKEDQRSTLIDRLSAMSTDELEKAKAALIEEIMAPLDVGLDS
jgi:hypothetical protein